MRWTRLLNFALILFFTVQASPVLAQELSKEERREWRDRAKDYRRNPAALKALVEERDEYRERAQAGEAQTTNLQATINAKERQLASYEEQIAELNQELLAAQQAPPPAPVEPSPMPGQDVGGDELMMDGVVFRVQIGAFTRNQIDESLDTSENLMLERNGNAQRVMVGQFTGYTEAKALRDRLRTMGVSDAFIAAYRDGLRVDVEEVTGNN